MRVGIYCRLSDEDRNKADASRDSESIQNQRTMLIRHAMNQGWDIYDIYCDDDYAGSDRNRPDFRRLLDDAEKHRLDIVLCKSQSRFSRELEIVERYIHGLFLEWNVRFIGLVDNADTEVKGNKKSRQINGLVNEWYLEDLSENVKSALESKKREGKFIGAFPLYGYKKSKQDKNKLVVDESAAAIVQRIYCLFREGYGIRAIARVLNEEGLPNPTAYKRSLGMKAPMGSNNGESWKLWTPSTIRQTLSNQMYIGDMVQGKLRKVSYKSTRLVQNPREAWVIVPNTHEPIIERSDWIATQQMLTHQPKMQKDGRVHLFAGKVFCMQCHSPLHIRSGRGHTKLLRCSLRAIDSKKCISSDIACPVLEELILNELNTLAKAYYDESMLDSRVADINLYDKGIAKARAEIDAANKRITDLSEALLNLYIDKSKGSVTEDMYATMYSKAIQDKEMLSRQLKAFEASLHALNEKKMSARNKTDIIREYKYIEKLTRQFVVCFIDRIEIGKRDPITKQLPIHIQWAI